MNVYRVSMGLARPISRSFRDPSFAAPVSIEPKKGVSQKTMAKSQLPDFTKYCAFLLFKQFIYFIFDFIFDFLPAKLRSQCAVGAFALGIRWSVEHITDSLGNLGWEESELEIQIDRHYFEKSGSHQ